MILSMTGFANKTYTLSSDAELVTLTVSIKSLNSRFFEATCKLSPALFNSETTIIKTLKRRLYRGHVYCTIFLGNSKLFGATVTPALKTVSSYIAALQQIKQEFGIEQPLALDHLVRLSGVFEIHEQSVDESLVKQVLQAVDQTCDLVVEERAREGEALKKDLLERIVVLRREITVIASEAERMARLEKEQLQQKEQELADNEELLLEVQRTSLALLEKIDINEETVRFNSHLDRISSLLETKEPEKGKHIDFVLQELMREISTIAAKCTSGRCPSVLISSSYIAIKVEIEKMREQVQNIV